MLQRLKTWVKETLYFADLNAEFDNIVNSIGEYIESTAAAVSCPATGAWGDLATISLTEGDWNVTAIVEFYANGATMTGVCAMGISTTPGNSAAGLTTGANRLTVRQPDQTLGSTNGTISAFRMIGPQTIYLKFLANYSAGTPQAYGRFSARRAC